MINIHIEIQKDVIRATQFVKGDSTLNEYGCAIMELEIIKGVLIERVKEKMKNSGVV